MQAIYGDDFIVGEASATLLAKRNLKITFFLETQSAAVSAPWLGRAETAQLVADLPEDGLFAVATEIMARLDGFADDEHESNQQHEDEVEKSPPPAWVESEAIKDRKSKFVAFAGKCETRAEAMRFIKAVRMKTNGCTHAIAAFDCGGECYRDDDGEGGAGDALLHLLEVLKIRNAVVVVARWYGGIKLGGDRFKRICEVAKMSLLQL